MSLTLDIGSGPKPKGDINLDIIPSKFCDIIGDAQFLPFRKGVFSKSYSSQVLEHLDYPQKAISEMSRILNDRGIAVIDVPKKNFTNNSFYCLLFFILNFPFIVMNPRYIKWVIVKLLKIRRRDISIFHKHIISPELISKYFTIKKTLEIGNILFYSINKGKLEKYLKNMPKINSSFLFIAERKP